MKGRVRAVIVALLVCGLAACGGVKTAVACAPGDSVDIRYVGTATIHIGDADIPYGKFHLVNRSGRNVAFSLAHKEPVLIVDWHSARIERQDPGAGWVWNAPALEEFPAPQYQVSIGPGDQADLHVDDGVFSASNHVARATYRLRVMDARCEYHSTPFELAAQSSDASPNKGPDDRTAG